MRQLLHCLLMVYCSTLAAFHASLWWCRTPLTGSWVVGVAPLKFLSIIAFLEGCESFPHVDEEECKSFNHFYVLVGLSLWLQEVPGIALLLQRGAENPGSCNGQTGLSQCSVLRRLPSPLTDPKNKGWKCYFHNKINFNLLTWILN